MKAVRCRDPSAIKLDTTEWPPIWPDLNPIEHIWDIVFRSIQHRQVAPQTVQELSDALVQIWGEMPQGTICCLIRSSNIYIHGRMA